MRICCSGLKRGLSNKIQQVLCAPFQTLYECTTGNRKLYYWSIENCKNWGQTILNIGKGGEISFKREKKMKQRKTNEKYE